MTRDEIVAAIAAAETTAETLRRMLAEMDGTPPPSAAAPITHRSRPVGIAVAERITGMSREARRLWEALALIESAEIDAGPTQ